jgi:hypothetical protein
MKSMKTILLAMAMVAALSGVALAQGRDYNENDRWDHSRDRDRRWGNDRNADAREYGFHNGYRDGWRQGRMNRARTYRNNDRRYGNNDRYRNNRGYSTRINDESGYQSAMGPKGQYKKGYRTGYREGYNDGINGRRAQIEGTWGPNGQWSVWDRDRDGDVDRDDWRYGQGGNAVGNGNAARFGFSDGQEAGRRDRASRHTYRPTEWESYRDADHGMSSSSGYRSSEEYKREYRENFMQGYNQAYGRR